MILLCKACGGYTLRAACSACGCATVTPHPAKYSVPDKYAEYRRKSKYPELFK
ncbi:MAG: nucleolar RNA-binding Nop10p family protein [Candidatus Micrarchaeota archaeon]